MTLITRSNLFNFFKKLTWIEFFLFFIIFIQVLVVIFLAYESYLLRLSLQAALSDITFLNEIITDFSNHLHSITPQEPILIVEEIPPAVKIEYINSSGFFALYLFCVFVGLYIEVYTGTFGLFV